MMGEQSSDRVQPGPSNSSPGTSSSSGLGSFFAQRFRPRRLENQNIIPRLFAREIHGATGARRPLSRLDTNRGFYTNVYPNFSLTNVEKPPCFLRKFTPDGRRFIAFSSDQTHLEIYQV